MALLGKGFYLWKIRECEGGDPLAIVNLAKQANLTHLLVKIANGIYGYNIDTRSGSDYIPPVVQEARGRGLQVWGWHYVYGDDPVGEANIAIQRLQKLSLDGYIIDAETEYKSSGKSAAAREYMTRLRAAFPNMPIALSSYRYPSYHPQLPWKEFLEKCDFNMPQVYWQGSHNPADQLARSVAEFQARTPFRPIIPTGAAYRSGSWATTAEDVVAFMQKAQAMNLTAANFWEWSHTRAFLPAVWDAIRDYSWPTTPPPVDITHQLVQALNSRDPEQAASLYAANAVHINASRTVQGPTAIRSWYSSLFSDLLPNASFTHTGFSGSGNTRHFTWSAAFNAGAVNNGSDTLGLYNGKIVYHFTTFTVSRSPRKQIRF